MSPIPEEGGVLPLDKPRGPTSHDAVVRVRKALDIRRVGHTGTLDPFASGLLLICVGPATRLSQYLTDLDKTYRATVRLGVRTATHDLEGEVVEENPGWSSMDTARIEEALSRFRGTIRQTPPAFSAKKVAGEPAHRRVRRGETVELAPVDVRVHELTLTGLELPDVHLEVRCSSGTYVRALARDLGEALGTGGHLVALRRTSVGAFRVDEALPLEGLTPDAVAKAWISPAGAVAHLPTVRVEANDVSRLASGQFLWREEELPAGPIAVLHGSTLVAVAVGDGPRLRPRKVFA